MAITEKISSFEQFVDSKNQKTHLKITFLQFVLQCHLIFMCRWYHNLLFSVIKVLAITNKSSETNHSKLVRFNERTFECAECTFVPPLEKKF